MHKYQSIISRAVIVFFLLTGSMSAWAATSLSVSHTNSKTECAHHVMSADAATMQHQQMADAEQHDCCKTQQKCNKHCCNFCLVNGVSSLVLLDNPAFPVVYQSASYDAIIDILPAGVKSTTPYRPPQTLLI